MSPVLGGCNSRIINDWMVDDAVTITGGVHDRMEMERRPVVIVVNGDAELVVALTTQSGQTKMECAGSLQNKIVRDTICSVMEGGHKAFEQRYRRIALGGCHV